MSYLFSKPGKKNTRNSYILGIFIFLFSSFFQLPSFNLPQSSFSDFNIIGVNTTRAANCAPGNPATYPVGGFVPCGRLIDNQETPQINEHAPCDICAMFYMLKNVLNYALQISLALAILMIVISGLLYAFSGGDGKRIETAKNAVYYALIGLAIMFLAWLIIASILEALGYGDIADWNQVNCNVVPGGPPTVLPFCGDGIVNNGEPCDWSVPNHSRACRTLVKDGLPDYCDGIMANGTQECNCNCDGWDACVAIAVPVLTEDKYGYDVCREGNKLLEGYDCCELYDCTGDQCCNGTSGINFSLPGGFQELKSIPFSNGYCKLGKNQSAPRNWYIGTSHTNASFRCWRAAE